MLNLDTFRKMAFEDKCDYITYYADYLMQRKVNQVKVYLYNVNNFFIEVWFDPDVDKVLAINSFMDHHCLEPYYHKVNLDGLGLMTD